MYLSLYLINSDALKFFHKGSEEAFGAGLDLGDTGVHVAISEHDGRDRLFEDVRGLRLPEEDPLRDGTPLRQLEFSTGTVKKSGP